MSEGRVIGVVPARLGSTRFPRKVLASLGGRPLVVRVLERLAAAELVERAFVVTDSPEVRDAIDAAGMEARIVEGDFATGSDRVAAAVAGTDAELVVNLQADQPLIEPADIDRTLGLLDEDPGLDIATLAFESCDAESYLDPHVVKVVAGEDGRALYFSRAPVPAFPEAAERNPWHLHHVGIYCFRRAALERFAGLPRSELETIESLEQLRAIENGMAMGVAVTKNASWSVDRPEDLARVERRIAGRD